MLTVALTGGIACGKSVVASILREKGCYVHSADKIAHELMAPRSRVWAAIVRRFGRGILRDDSTIDRSRLGEIVFSDTSGRAFLNSLIHPLVMARQRKTIASLRREGRTMIYVSEAALTVEAGLARFFDKVVIVLCRQPVQIRRIMDRNRLTRREALARIRAQMPQDEKAKAADYVIDASGTLGETVEQTERVYACLVRDYELKKAFGLASDRRASGRKRKSGPA